jgi:hypothetical protein
MSDRSLIQMFATGLRVASSEYTPAHSKIDGGVRKNVSAKLAIVAYHNIPSKANDGKGKSESLNYTFCGALADIAAKTLSQGKEFHCISFPNTYPGTVYVPGPDGKSTGVPGQWANGQVIKTKKVSFTVINFTLGQDAAKLIADEIARKVRPSDWNTPGTPGHTTWSAMQKERMKVKFQPGFTEFGYAKVKAPTGEGIAAFDPSLAKTNAQPTTTQIATSVQAVAGPAFPAAAAPAGVVAPVVANPSIQLVNAKGGF